MMTPPGGGISDFKRTNSKPSQYRVSKNYIGPNNGNWVEVIRKGGHDRHNHQETIQQNNLSTCGGVK